MEMIHKSSAAHAGQWDTRLGSGARWGLWCHRSEVLIEVAGLDVLAALTRPFQGDPSIFPRTPAVEFCLEIIGLCAPH